MLSILIVSVIFVPISAKSPEVDTWSCDFTKSLCNYVYVFKSMTRDENGLIPYKIYPTSETLSGAVRTRDMTKNSNLCVTVKFLVQSTMSDDEFGIVVYKQLDEKSYHIYSLKDGNQLKIGGKSDF